MQIVNMSLIFLTINMAFACKPYNGNKNSSSAAQQQVRICQATAEDKCLSYQSAAYTQDSLKLTSYDKNQTEATWYLFENDEFLTLQPVHDSSQTVVLQKASSDLQQTKLISPVSQKYLRLVDGAISWAEKEDQGTEFRFLFLSQVEQTNSLR